MRVISGSLRGLRLKSPSDYSIRPTTDRAKEGLFNVLNQNVLDSTFLDLFAGSGAIGIEACSRGAKRVVFVENTITGEKTKCNEAILTFVAIDQNGSPLPVPSITPETELEKKRFDGALRRRQLSLILSGRMKPDEATELKALFLKD